MSSPIITLSPSFTDPELVSSYEVRQVWRGRFRGAPAVLRCARLPDALRPTIDRKIVLTSVAKIANALDLPALVGPLATGGADGGFYVVEPEVGDVDATHLAPQSWREVSRLLAPIARDLVTLHQYGKWHGGIRPSRVRRTRDGGRLVGFTWASTASTLTRDQLRAVEEPGARHRAPFMAPELVERGPAYARPATDVHGLARTTFFLANGSPRAQSPRGVSARTFEVLTAATAPEAQDRPGIDELAAIFDTA